MQKLENYLYDYVVKSNKNTLESSFIDTFKYFGYVSKELFKIDLELLIEFVYKDLKIIEQQEFRLLQDEFKKILKEKYGSKCLISGNPVEYQACHIVEHHEGGSSDVNNGLLLEHNLHFTFDNRAWAINPDTLLIEINPNKQNYSILKYTGKKVNLVLNPFLYANLAYRYNQFLIDICNNS